LSPSSPGFRRLKNRLPVEEEQQSFGLIPDDELISLVSQGGFHSEQSCEAVEEVLRRGLECPDAIALMRDILFGFEAARLRYRAAVCLVRLDCWDNDVHRALCQAASRLPLDEPLARSARLQLQKRGFSPANHPERPQIGESHAMAQTIRPKEASEPREVPQSTPQNVEVARELSDEPEPSPAAPLPRYTLEDLEEPRLRYRRRKRKRGNWIWEVLSNLQIVLLFLIGFAVFILLLGRL